MLIKEINKFMSNDIAFTSIYDITQSINNSQSDVKDELYFDHHLIPKL